MRDPLVPEPRYGASRLFVIGLIFVLIAPLFWLLTEQRTAQPPEGFENADLYQRIYPQFNYAFGRLADGDLPLWNPQQLCGVPLHTDPRVGIWSPLNAVFLGLDTERAMAVHAYLSLALMGLGTALTLRALGASYLAALFGGIVFAFSGAAAGVMSRPGAAGTLAFAPWVLWAAVEHGGRFKWMSGMTLALLAALMVLAGSYALSAVFLLFTAFVLIYLTFFPLTYDVPPLTRRIATLVFTALLTAGLTSIQWLPSLIWALRTDGVAEAIWNLSPAAITPATLRDLASHLLLTDSGALPRAAYLGIAALPLIPAALLHRDARPLVWPLVLLVPAFWALWMLGRNGLPWRFPAEAFIYPATLSAALLAALGLDRVFMTTQRRGFALHVPPVLLFLVGAAALFIAVPGAARGYLLAGALAVILFFIFRRKWAAVLAMLAVAVLQFVDLSVANTNRFHHPFLNAPECYTRYGNALDTAREQALGSRALVSASSLDWGLPANVGMISPLRVVNGASIPLYREQALWWQIVTGSPRGFPWPDAQAVTPGTERPYLLNYMAARAIVTAPDGPMAAGHWAGPGPPLREVRTDGEGRVFVNDQALPRAYWVPAVHIADNPDDAIALLAEGELDPDRACIVDRSTPGIQRMGGEILAMENTSDSPPALSRTDGACQVEDVSAERVTIRVQAPQLGMVVLADTFAPGWSATVDGARQVILRTNGMFRGVSVPPGEHTVTFVYRPLPLYVGGLGSALSLLVLVTAGIIGCWRFFRGPRVPKTAAAPSPAQEETPDMPTIRPFKKEDR